MAVPLLARASAVDSAPLRLMCADDKEVYMPRIVAKLCITLQEMLDDGFGNDSNAIPVPNVTSAQLELVLQYCQQHLESPSSTHRGGAELSAGSNSNASLGGDLRSSDLSEWEHSFFRRHSDATMYGLLLAANYLNIKCLLEACCMAAAESLRHKTPAEIRTLFNIKNDFTPEEEKQLEQENEWTASIVLSHPPQPSGTPVK